MNTLWTLLPNLLREPFNITRPANPAALTAAQVLQLQSIRIQAVSNFPPLKWNCCSLRYKGPSQDLAWGGHHLCLLPGLVLDPDQWRISLPDLSMKLWVGWTREAEVRARQRRQQVERDDICAEYSSQKHRRNIVRRQRRLSLLLTSAGGRKNMLFYLNLCFQWKPSAFSKRHKPTRKNYFSPNYHNLTRSRTCT